LLSAIDRIGADSRGRPTIVVFFSDMLNATPELNMERDTPKPEAIIPDLASRHGWGPDTLANVRLYCVLNGLHSGDPSGPDIRNRKAFYGALFRALGGELAMFDTHFDSTDKLLAKGGRHDRN
jgi:hypothetical protein